MLKWHDRALVERIRAEVRCVDDCDIYWFPKMRRLQQMFSDTGVPLGHRATNVVGCWAFAALCEVPYVVSFRGQTIVATKQVTVPILKLDGKYGNPLRPGDWIRLAEQEGLEPPSSGFGDRRSSG